MKLVNSFLIAFAMYSKIPVPRADWTKENMRYAMCFFPFVGLVIGAITYLWARFGILLPFGSAFYTVILMLIPIALTGGIHLDGLLDTTDAISSYQTMERRLEILKDSNSGAFAIIGCVVYFFLDFGVLANSDLQMIEILALGFVFSRTLSGMSIATFQCARNSGLAATFANGADKKKTAIVLGIEMCAVIVGMLLISPLYGVLAVVAAFCVFAYYRRMSYRLFGGITGDLAGWFLQISELVMAMAVVLGGSAIKMFI